MNFCIIGKGFSIHFFMINRLDILGCSGILQFLELRPFLQSLRDIVSGRDFHRGLFNFTILHKETVSLFQRFLKDFTQNILTSGTSSQCGTSPKVSLAVGLGAKSTTNNWAPSAKGCHMRRWLVLVSQRGIMQSKVLMLCKPSSVLKSRHITNPAMVLIDQHKSTTRLINPTAG